MTKSERQTKILDIIANNVISTQEELVKRLNEEGYNVTQATTSRDLQELRITKLMLSDGTYKYAVAKLPEISINEKMRTVFTQCLMSVDYANNIVVIKTFSGAAQAVAAALDSFVWDEIIGSIAGDDTIMVVVRNEKSAKQLAVKLSRYIK
ncbi:MAG: arginine repressor [Ruminococcaceae bacterium]|nr:arginine repressor [Oscillospiraceae bacterium]